MKTNFFIIFVVLGLCAVAGLIASTSALAATNYTISKITDNTYTDRNPKINDSGDIIWLGDPVGSKHKLFLYDGNITVQLANNVNQTGISHNINEEGQVVWNEFIGSDIEIMFYDGISITRLTENTYNDMSCNINAIGEIVWYGPQSSEGEIFLYDGKNIAQLTNNSYEDSYPQINTSGQVVWTAKPVDSSTEIMLYDGNSTIQLTNNSNTDSRPKINASGHVVWMGGDDSNREIFLYNKYGVTQLTNNSFEDTNPEINSSGYVVWRGYDGSDFEIFLWDGISITQLTNNNYHDSNPVINDSGHVAWKGEPTDVNGEIFLWDGISITQLTDDIYNKDSGIDINAFGQIVWYAHDGDDYEIYLATPVPTPDIKANGSDGPLTIPQGDLLSVTTSLLCGDKKDENADWWYLAQTPKGWFHWVWPGVWKQGIRATYQMPLFDYPESTLFEFSSLPPATYKIYFGVDMNMNGLIDMDQMYYDDVEVTITP